MLIDTHCHLDAPELAADRDEVIGQAVAAGVHAILIPSVEANNFDTVRELAHSFDQGCYALGIHPLYVQQAQTDALDQLKLALETHQNDPKLIAIGEIGLDFFIPELSTKDARQRQEYFYEAQLDLAVEFKLPVLLHVRRSQDTLLKYLRRRSSIGGFAHAFNGSLQQAHQFVDLGFALGMGGAMTYSRALQIQRIAQTIPLESLVLETDSPDIAPAWQKTDRRNTPAQVLGVARHLAELRGQKLEDIIETTGQTATRVCPKLALAFSTGRGNRHEQACAATERDS